MSALLVAIAFSDALCPRATRSAHRRTGVNSSGSDSMTLGRANGGDGVTSSVTIALRVGPGDICTARWVGLFIAAALPLFSPFLPFSGPPADPGVHITKAVGLSAQFAVDLALLSHFAANVERGIIFKWVRSLALLLVWRPSG